MQGKPKKRVIGIKCISAKLYQPDQAARTQTATMLLTHSKNSGYLIFRCKIVVLTAQFLNTHTHTLKDRTGNSKQTDSIC